MMNAIMSTQRPGAAQTAPAMVNTWIGGADMAQRTRPVTAKTLSWRQWFAGLTPDRQEVIRQKSRERAQAQHVAQMATAEGRAALNAAQRRRYAADLEANRARGREQQQRYRERHPESGSTPSAVAAYNAAWKFGESVPTEEWERVWSGPCFDCGVTPAKGVDHVIPFSRGGRNIIENLQPACRACNLRKGAS